ncbi:MAG: PQQ-binding-like beta-propeller repeat protein [Candidatus Zixiibacteriota bacterium]
MKFRIPTLQTLALTLTLPLFTLALPAQCAAETMALAWKFHSASPFITSPIVKGDLVLVGGLDSTFYALDLATGTLVWKAHTEGEIRSTAMATESAVCFLSGDGLVRYLDLHTGKPIWTFPTGGERKHDFADYYQSSPVQYDSLVYFGSGDSTVYALRILDGFLVWKCHTGDVIHARPAVDSLRLYVGSFDGYFYAFDRLTGKLIWKFKSVGHDYFPKGEFQGSPTLYRDILFVGARDYNLYALDREKGYCHWNKSYPRGWALPTVVHDTTLYVGTSDDRVQLSLDPATGHEFWRTNLKFNIFGSIAIVDTIGYVGTLMGKLFGLNIRTGEIVWTFNTDGYVTNHLAYFKPDDSFRDDIFEKVKSNEAFIEVEYQIGAFYSAAALADNYLVAASADGTVYCFKRQ